jgi:carbon-monoxide dehydrogenase large subunit
VHLSVLPEGVVDLAVGTQSTGQGHATSYAQVVADELGIAPAQVRLVTGDTQRVASGGGTHSDRSMRLVGTLLVEACAKLRDLASEMSGLQPEEIDLFDLARRTPISADAVFTGRLPAYPTGTAVCELEIDAETGQIEVTRYTSVDDVGQPINPLILHGQTHGGIVQGVGQALTEQVVFDQQSGQPLSASFADYALLGAAAVPAFDVTLVEDPTQGNPLRIKGGGESGITPSLAAVVNAAVDAMAGVGITHLEMPLTPFRMWQALTKSPPELG